MFCYCKLASTTVHFPRSLFELNLTFCPSQINGTQFVAYIFFGPETIYNRKQPPKPAGASSSVFVREYLTFKCIDSTPLRLHDFCGSVFLGKFPTVLLPTIAYSLVFGFANVMTGIEIPQLFGEKFHFGPQQIGYQFVGTIIG